MDVIEQKTSARLEDLIAHEHFTLVVVDDDLLVLRALKRLLGHAHLSINDQHHIPLTVHAFNSPTDALALVKSTPVHLIITDQVMPQMQGLTFLKQVRAWNTDAVAILLTGEYELSVAIEAVNSGNVFRFINKPWDNQNLLETVQLAFERYVEKTREHMKFSVLEENQEKLTQKVETLNSQLQSHAKVLEAQRHQLNVLEGEQGDVLDLTLDLMLSLLELGHESLVSHTQRTVMRVLQFCQHLKISSECQTALIHAANLHWIGLLNAPPALFNKPIAEFDVNERALWEFHPLLGQQILSTIPALQVAGQIIVNYQTPYQGGANQNILTQIQHDDVSMDEGTIRLCGYVLAICSAFERECGRIERTENVLNHKVVERATYLLRSQMGTHFHPELVHRFSTYLDTSQSHDRQEQCLKSVMELRIGMVLSRPLEAPGGIPIIASGTEVTAALIERLIFFEDTFDEWIRDLYVWG